MKLEKESQEEKRKQEINVWKLKNDEPKLREY